MGTGDILLGGKPCHGLASPPGGGGGSNTPRLASCYGNRNMGSSGRVGL